MTTEMSYRKETEEYVSCCLSFKNMQESREGYIVLLELMSQMSLDTGKLSAADRIGSYL